MKLCVTGGAGYIGSVVAQVLVDEGHDVTVIDNLSTGHTEAIPEGARLIEGDIRDGDTLDRALGTGIDAVLHFAAMSVVPESVEEPMAYYDNNVGGSIRLLEAVQKYGIGKFVFSSSAAVYGNPEELPIVETARCEPSNPYGFSKLMVEQMLHSCRIACGLSYVSLRYFNAGGSTDRHGEYHNPETHLIPVILDVVMGKRGAFSVFGDDYDTPDGTCIRDYIHVRDLADAHVLSLKAMEDGFSGVLNLGSETPFTVLEVIKTVERVTGKKVNYQVGDRRPGDPPALLASSQKAEEVLGWRKTHSSLEKIVRSAYEWRLQHPDGYTS
jgi:UDP-glucose 4-epimerase